MKIVAVVSSPPNILFARRVHALKLTPPLLSIRSVTSSIHSQGNQRGILKLGEDFTSLCHAWGIEDAKQRLVFWAQRKALENAEKHETDWFGGEQVVGDLGKV